MKSQEIRQRFFTFFQNHGHTKVSSSSLIPAHDPTLLFTNAGMNQFKEVFLGKENQSYSRAVTIQKCMRAGGKHSDLDDVGFTKRHLTFFEMMGNFSFGDYFKKEAIQYAWNFLTKEMAFAQKNMYATVYKEDQESHDLWLNMIGLPQERIISLGVEHNFWQMGDVGPCGPCTEIYFDRGIHVGCGKKECNPGCSCDRFLEVWNLVFMEYDRQADGTDKPLQQKGVDTGMGLERLCVIMQQVDSVFDIDLFKPYIEYIEKMTSHIYAQQNKEKKASFHVLSDHARAATFLIADGCVPSNDGRGYVLRKIIRRAALFSRKLIKKNLFPELADIVIAEMGSIYPNLTENRILIRKILCNEIERFQDNLERGRHILDEYLAHISHNVLSGEQAFILYDTYGFPLELTAAMAREKGYSVNKQEFEALMEEQRIRSGKKMKEIGHEIASLPESISTKFTGYDSFETHTIISALLINDVLVEEVPANSECWIITKESPFYVERGGQVSDTGIVCHDGGCFSVEEVKYINSALALKITPGYLLNVGDTVTLKIDKEARLATMKNHTATHLLQAALMLVFGKQIKQAGSLVAPDYLRFDFTFHDSVNPKKMTLVENIINQKIWENLPILIKKSTYKDALDKGIIAFFGEKYNPDEVRIIEIPEFSAELCGGTHVERTGDIGCFKIIETTALSAGQKRIVAYTGPGALKLFQKCFTTMKHLSQQFKVPFKGIEDAITQQSLRLKSQSSQIKNLSTLLWKAYIPIWLEQSKVIKDIPILITMLDEIGPEYLKDIVHTLQQQQPGIYIFFSTLNKKIAYFGMIHATYINRLNLKNFSEWLKNTFALKGSAKDGMLQGGSATLSPHTLEKIKNWIIAHVE